MSDLKEDILGKRNKRLLKAIKEMFDPLHKKLDKFSKQFKPKLKPINEKPDNRKQTQTKK